MTYALATQLVVSRARARSATTRQRELAAIWADLQAFGERIEGVPLAELRDRLTEFENRILDVVQQESAGSPAEADGPASETTTDDGTADGDPASSTGTDADGTTVDGDGSTGSTGTATPTGTSTAPSTSSAPTSAPASTTEAGTASATQTAEASPTG